VTAATTPGRDGRAPQGFAGLLAELATPEVLRDNPFRIVGLPTDASNQELRRRAERIRRDPDVPAHQAERVEAALRRLRDPVRRLVDELLWFWPDEADAGTGHNAAVTALLRLVEGADADPAVGDVGVPGGPGEATELFDPGVVERGGVAIDALAGSLRTRTTAGYVAARAAALDDPRIAASGGARQLVDEAQQLVPLVALRMAARAHAAGETAVAAALAVTVPAHTDADVARAAAATAVEPAIGRVRALVDTAERQSPGDREGGAARAARLLEQTAADRALIDVVLGIADPARVGLVDRLVDQVVADAVASYNETDDLGPTVDLLQRARDLRPGPALAARIDGNLAIIRDNAALGVCWFCLVEPNDPRAQIEVDLYGDVDRDHGVGRVTWSTTKLVVPRGLTCATSQQRRDNRGCSLGGAASVLGGAVVGGLLAATSGGAVAFVAAVVWLVLSLVLGTVALVRIGRDVRRRMQEFPPLQEKLASGWAFGTRPPGAR
jgi:hypothetical protein